MTTASSELVVVDELVIDLRRAAEGVSPGPYVVVGSAAGGQLFIRDALLGPGDEILADPVDLIPYSERALSRLTPLLATLAAERQARAIIDLDNRRRAAQALVAELRRATQDG